MIQERLDLTREIVAVGRIHLRRHLQREAEALGQFDGEVGSLLARHPPEEREIVAAAGRKRILVQRKTVIHGAGPCHAETLEGQTLRMADRHERLVSEMPEDREDVRQVQTAVQGVQTGGTGQSREGKGEVPDVAVDHVEFPSLLENPGQLEKVEGQIVLGRGVETERARRRRHQLGFRA